MSSLTKSFADIVCYSLTHHVSAPEAPLDIQGAVRAARRVSFYPLCIGLLFQIHLYELLDVGFAIPHLEIGLLFLGAVDVLVDDRAGLIEYAARLGAVILKESDRQATFHPCSDLEYDSRFACNTHRSYSRMLSTPEVDRTLHPAPLRQAHCSRLADSR